MESSFNQCGQELKFMFKNFKACLRCISDSPEVNPRLGSGVIGLQKGNFPKFVFNVHDIKLVAKGRCDHAFRTPNPIFTWGNFLVSQLKSKIWQVWLRVRIPGKTRFNNYLRERAHLDCLALGIWRGFLHYVLCGYQYSPADIAP